jgi:hypothetical protein
MTDGATRSAVAEQQRLPRDAWRMMGLETASELLGHNALAEALSIDPRSLRYKIQAGRGVSDVDITLAAGALEASAARMADHARKLRAALAPESAAA